MSEWLGGDTMDARYFRQGLDKFCLHFRHLGGVERNEKVVDVHVNNRMKVSFSSSERILNCVTSYGFVVR